MARISTGTIGLAIGSAVAVVAVALAGGGFGPFGPDRPLDPGACYFIYTMIVQILLLYLVICTRRCDEEDRNCTIICVRRFFYLFIIANILLLVCLFGNLLGGGFS